MRKTIFYFMRHGQVYNPKQVLYGRLPRFPLSQEGRKQVGEAVAYFKTKNIDIIYCSPLLRARQTAKIVGDALGLKSRISQMINEVDLLFAGMPLSRYKEEIQPTLYQEKHIQKGQESIEKISQRMLSFLHRIGNNHPGKTILVVSHGDPIVVLKAYLAKMPFTWEYKRDNYIQTAKWIKVEHINRKK